MDLGIRGKIFTITLDNAINNDTTLYRLKKNWQIKDDHSKLFHVHFCAHILNLIIKYGLKQVDSTLQKIRNIIYGINNSQAKHELFF